MIAGEVRASDGCSQCPVIHLFGKRARREKQRGQSRYADKLS
jgi:hypothetical protein